MPQRWFATVRPRVQIPGADHFLNSYPVWPRGLGACRGACGSADRSSCPCVVVAEATYRPETTSDRASPQVRRELSRLLAVSGREREVLRLLGAGLSNAGIAAELALSERTIDAHLRSVFGKLELPDSRHDNRRVQAAAIWAREAHVPTHLVDAPEMKV